MRLPPSTGTIHPRRTDGWRGWPVLGLLFRGRTANAEGRDWVSTVLGVGLVIGFAIVMGQQYVTPDKRVLGLIAAAVMFGITWRLDLVSGLGVLVLALPYPRGTVFGSTNLALVLLLLVIWLLRGSLRQAPLPHRTPVDRPLVALLLAFIVSFYNVERTAMSQAFENFWLLLACFAMFYMFVNNVRTPQDLERVHVFQCISIGMVCLFGVYELRNPGGVLVPGWIEFRGSVSEGINLHNMRLGGPFFDYELMSEYCALNLLLLTFLFVRARSMARKAIFGGLLVLASFIMFATVTRGGVLALIAGIAYLAWLQRKRIKMVHVVLVLVIGLAGIQAMNFYVANFTYSGDLLARMMAQDSMTFIDGMPSSRAHIWRSAFERWMEHPIIGHGPVYTVMREIGFWFWPHNGYLYVANLVGIVGLTCYLWLLVRLWRISSPQGHDMLDPNYARAYLVIGHVQLMVFLVDQIKIDFLRNPTYQFQVWLLFAYIVSAYQASRLPPAAAPPAPRRS